METIIKPMENNNSSGQKGIAGGRIKYKGVIVRKQT